MAAEAFIERVTFAGGEIGQALAARSDLGKYQVSLAAMENYVTMVEGGATRAPGTRFVAELKTSAQKGKLIPYRRSSSDYYMLVINNGVSRFVQAGGVLLTGGVPTEMAVPWVEADLPNIRAVPDGNNMYACDGVRATLITRTSLTVWTASAFPNIGGPVGTINPDPTVNILASANTGAGITLTGTGTNFQAGNIGGVWRLDESDLSLIPEWIANEAIVVPTAALPARTGDIGDMATPANAWDGNTATASTKNATSGYQGGHYVAATSIYQYRIRMTTAGAEASCTFTLYGKQGGAPANATDGTVLATANVNDGLVGFGSGRGWDVTLTSSNFNSTYDYIWISWAITGAAAVQSIAELNPIQFSAGGAAIYRRWNGNVYQALSGTNSGQSPPVHTKGDVLAQQGGAIWRYIHRDRGFVRITAVGSTTSATADVLEILPLSVAQRATQYFWPAAWDAIAGYPTAVAFSKSRLMFMRGPFFWGSAIDLPFDFDLTGQDDDAIAGKLRSPDGSQVDIQWALHAGVLILGSSDIEWSLRGATAFSGLTPGTLTPVPDNTDGSVAQIPAGVDGGVIYVGKSGKRLHFGKFDLNDTNSQRVSADEISVTARHIFVAGVQAIAWQRDPQRVLWMAMADGTLAALTFMPKQQIVAFHRHPRNNFFVEDISVIPSTASGTDEVYLIVRRTISGATKRYVELLQPYFVPVNPAAATAIGAWFLDCALRYQGAPATVINGLGQLEGQTVGVLADGAMQTRKVVTGGAITLDRAASDVLVGLPIVARLQDLPRNLNTSTGPTDGQDKTISEGYLNLLFCGGGVLSANDGPAEDVIDTGGDDYGVSPPLFTGDKRIPIEGELRQEAQMQLLNDDAMPCTVLGMSPRLRVEED